jgi:hypothetical protein
MILKNTFFTAFFTSMYILSFLSLSVHADESNLGYFDMATFDNSVFDPTVKNVKPYWDFNGGVSTTDSQEGVYVINFDGQSKIQWQVFDASDIFGTNAYKVYVDLNRDGSFEEAPTEIARDSATTIVGGLMNGKSYQAKIVGFDKGGTESSGVVVLLNPTAQFLDSDGDGVSNTIESALNMNPVNADTDGDGVSDRRELLIKSDPLVADTDSDGFFDGDEITSGTNPVSAGSTPTDTDTDGLSDVFELRYSASNTALNASDDLDADGLTNAEEQRFGTDPTKGDTDGDEITDKEERENGLNPLNTSDSSKDTDGDGLTNKEEVQIGTNVNRYDTDGDGINDQDESEVTNTNPLLADTDGDGVNDGQERILGTDPNDQTDLDTDLDGIPENLSTLGDTNTNGLSDDFEALYPTATDPIADTDGDGLINIIEHNLGTDPTSIDSDSDGITDNLEVISGLDPNNASDAGADFDVDGLNNLTEVNQGTSIYILDSDKDGLSDIAEVSGDMLSNPLNPDTDGDGVMDSMEILLGTDPSVSGDMSAYDSDSDGLFNIFEAQYPSIASLPFGDNDSDGLLNIEEQFYYTNPLLADSDYDSIADLVELSLELEPYYSDDVLLDYDGDGINNKQEYLNKTNIFDIDDKGFIPVSSPASVINDTTILWKWSKGNVNNSENQFYDGDTGDQLATIGANAEDYLETNLIPNTSYSRYIKEKFGSVFFRSSNMNAITLSADNDIISANSRDIYTWYNTVSFDFSSNNLITSKIEKYQYIWNQTPDTLLTGCTDAQGSSWTSGSLALSGVSGDNYLHILSCNSADVSASEGSKTYGPYRYDGTSPVVSNLYINNGSGFVSNSTVTLQVSAYDLGGSIMNTMTLSGDILGSSSGSFGYTPVKSIDLSAGNGDKVINVLLYDNAGNVSDQKSITISIDTSGVTMDPIEALYSKTSLESQLADNWWSDNQPYFTWGASTGPSGIQGYSIAMDSVPNDIVDTTANNYEYTVTGLTEGSHTLQIKAQNKAGALSSIESFIYKVDTVNPVHNIVFPVNNTAYGSSTWTTISGTATDASSGLQKVELQVKRLVDSQYFNGTSFQAGTIFLDATGTTNWSYDLDIADLNTGDYELIIKTIDNARIEGGTFNTRQETISFTIDVTDPLAPSINPATGTEINPSVRPVISSDIGGKVYICFDNSTTVNTSSTDAGICETYTEHALDSSGNYTFGASIPLESNPIIKAYIIDAAGNQGPTSTTNYTYSSSLTSINPSSASIGDTITLTGAGFGSAPSPLTSGVVTFTGANATGANIVSWSDTEVQVKIPSGAETGSVSITSTNIGVSNTMSFSIISVPTSIVLAPSGDITMTVGESKVFAAYAKDIAGNVLNGATFTWSQSPSSPNNIGTITGGTDSVVSFTAIKAGVSIISVSTGAVTPITKTITVYDSVSSNNISCTKSGSLRLDFRAYGENGSSLGIDTDNTTVPRVAIKTYGTGDDTVKIYNYQGTGVMQSQDLYAGNATVKAVRLTKHDLLTNDDLINYEVSFDGGTNWITAIPGQTVNGSGKDILWKATLTGTSPTLYWASLEMSITSNIADLNLPDGDYVYAPKNCSTGSIYQIGTLEELDSGVNTAKVQGNYTIEGDNVNYSDPGPLGIYDSETDIGLLQKYLKKE